MADQTESCLSEYHFFSNLQQLYLMINFLGLIPPYGRITGVRINKITGNGDTAADIVGEQFVSSPYTSASQMVSFTIMGRFDFVLLKNSGFQTDFFGKKIQRTSGMTAAINTTIKPANTPFATACLRIASPPWEAIQGIRDGIDLPCFPPYGAGKLPEALLTPLSGHSKARS